MGRFFKQNLPSGFGNVGSSIYQDPTSLIYNLIQKKDQAVKENLAKSELLEGAVDEIPHLNFEAENERVANLQQKYRDAIDRLSNQIAADPLNARRYSGKIKQLRRQMQKDKSSGEWFQIESRYNDYNKWVKDNQKLKEDDPALYNQLNAHWYEDVVNRATEDADARFRGEQGISRINLLKDYKTVFDAIKSNTYEEKSGKYRYKNKYVSEDELSNIAWNTLVSDKNFRGYSRQMGQILGQPGYLDESGQMLNPFQLIDKDGGVLTYEEYERLPDSDKQGVKKVLNPQHAYHSEFSALQGIYGFQEQTVKADEFEKQKALQKIRQEDELSSLKLQLEETMYTGDSEEAAKAQNMLNVLTAKQTVTTLGNPASTFDSDYELVQQRREKSPTFNSDGTPYFYAAPGTTEYGAMQKLKNSTEYGKNKLKKGVIPLSNGENMKASEYLDWLGDRKNNEEVAKEFLERRKGIYQKAEFESSLVNRALNSVRSGFVPDFIKSDQAVDLDKVYNLGEELEDYRKEWYEKNTGATQVLNAQPINDVSVMEGMRNEMISNKKNFFVTDNLGDKVDNDVIDKISPTTPLSVISANAHSEMAVKVNLEGEDYFIFPNTGNDAEINLMKGLSMKGVGKDTQYYREMSERASNDLLHKLNQSGKNSKGTNSIVMKVNGKLLSLELVGNSLNVRDPLDNINTEPRITFDSVQKFIESIY